MVARSHKQHDDEDGVGDFYDPNLDPDRYEGIHIVTSDEEAMEILDQRARYELGITGEEFLRRWDAGDYGELRELPDTTEGRRIARLVFMIPFVRLADV